MKDAIKPTERLYWGLPELPFEPEALEPVISSTAIRLHHRHHHKSYVDKLNLLMQGSRFKKMPLEEVILKAKGPLYTNAAQVWNHTFFWNCLAPKSQPPITGKFYGAIVRSFGSMGEFKEKFIKAGEELFGSGYVWLVRDKSGGLMIITGKDAYNPLTQSLTPVLVVDVWEHSYYLDYLNSKRQFLRNIWDVINWEFADSQYRKI